MNSSTSSSTAPEFKAAPAKHSREYKDGQLKESLDKLRESVKDMKTTHPEADALKLFGGEDMGVPRE